MTRVAVLRHSANPAQMAQFVLFRPWRRWLKVEVIPANMRDAGKIERAVESFARSSNGGLIVVGSGALIRDRDLIVTLAAQHKLPAVDGERFFVVAGGLISYGAHTIDQYRRAAGYVDRILKGEKPADYRCRRDQVRDGHQPEDGQGAGPIGAMSPPAAR